MPESGAGTPPVRQIRTSLGREGVIILLRVGAYLCAMTLTVVSRLHRHASH